MEYWQRENHLSTSNALYELRGNLALCLIERWGGVSGKITGEDKAGRAVLDIEPPTEFVERCCTIADLTLSALESRGWIKQDTRTPEDIARHKAEIDQIESDIRFDFERLNRKDREAKAREDAAEAERK